LKGLRVELLIVDFQHFNKLTINALNHKSMLIAGNNQIRLRMQVVRQFSSIPPNHLSISIIFADRLQKYFLMQLNLLYCSHIMKYLLV
jgi:hypothetical protein